LAVLRGSDLPDRWTVEIDAEGALDDAPVDGAAVETLIDRLSDYSPSVSHRPRRYTTRLSVYATDALQAVEGSVEIWREAIQQADLPDWEIARIEVSHA
jgi:hypothetical protein